MRRFALQFYLVITTIANCNLFFIFILLVPASGTAAATGSVAAAVCPEPQKATDTSALGNDEELPPANISATAFAKGDRVRAKSRGQGGMWVHGTIKFVNPKKKNQDRTYKVLYDDDLQFMTAFHRYLEPEPEKDESSASEDAGALHGLGLGDDNNANEGVTQPRRHTRASSTQGNKKIPPPKNNKSAKRKAPQSPEKLPAKNKTNKGKGNDKSSEVDADEDDFVYGASPFDQPVHAPACSALFSIDWFLRN
jgi:hypothetical protein